MQPTASPSQLEFHRNMLQAAALPLGLSIAFAGFLLYFVLRLVSLSESVEHSDQVLTRANTIYNLLLERESALHGYIITENPNFLEPYDRADSQLPGAWRSLRDFVSDNPSQVSRLDIVQRKGEEWSSFAAEAKAKVDHGESAKSLVATERGKRLMEETRQKLAGFSEAESTLRNERSQKARTETRRLLAATLLIAVSLGIIISMVSRRQLAKITQIYADSLTRSQATAEAQARLAAIVDSSDDAIIGKTLGSIVTSWNPAAERLFGYRPDEAIGKPIMRLLPADRQDEEKGILERLRRGERVDHFETVRVTKDGRPIEVSLTISPIKDHSGQIVGASKIARDITSRKRLEEDKAHLLESERAARTAAEHASRMKDEFLATLSHELRTPLNAILGWAQLLRRASKEDPDWEQGLETIERSARMQAQLIEDLLDMSRVISGKLRLDIQRVMPISFVEAAIETVQPAAEVKSIRIETMLDPLAGPVSGDPNRLQQVVWNLLSNAIKFTPRGGKVQVVLGRVNSHIEITVADTGQGIDPGFLPFVFERFRQADASTTRKAGGLGLGLSIVKQLVELHSGLVCVNSAGEGQGATFIVHLPVSVVQPQSDEGERLHPRTPAMTQAGHGQVDLKGIRVLVVDDEPDARALIQRVLANCGAEVFIAGSAAEGLALLEPIRPDVLVSDIGMPEMDGYEFLRRVRALGVEKGGKTPAVALTAFARSEDRTRALMAGYLVHVAKPVQYSELVATVASVAGRTGLSFENTER